MDFSNPFLNKDKTLYTLIISKLGAHALLCLVDVFLEGPSTDRLITEPLLFSVIAGYEAGIVALNRVVVDSVKGDSAEFPKKAAYKLLANTPLSTIDLVASSKLSGINLFNIVPDVITQNPIVTSLPESSLPETSGSLLFVKKIVSMGIPVLLYSGMWLQIDG